MLVANSAAAAAGDNTVRTSGTVLLARVRLAKHTPLRRCELTDIPVISSDEFDGDTFFVSPRRFYQHLYKVPCYPKAMHEGDDSDGFFLFEDRP